MMAHGSDMLLITHKQQNVELLNQMRSTFMNTQIGITTTKQKKRGISRTDIVQTLHKT